MRKRIEAKVAQGYIKEPACCRTCTQYTSDRVPFNRWLGDRAIKETNRRCDLGGFATQPSAHCRFFTRKP